MRKNRKGVVIVVLGALLLTVALFSIIPAMGVLPYDPMKDVNDDGVIDAKDYQAVKSRIPSTGTPINKTALLELQSEIDELNASLRSLIDALNTTLGLQIDSVNAFFTTQINSLNASLIELESRMAALEQSGGSIYRWNVFDTYLNNYAWLCENNASLYGGVPPNQWTDSGAMASQMSSDKEFLRTLFSQKGYGGKNALVYSNVFIQFSSTTGRVVVCLFRIRNTMDEAINWTPYFRYTCDWNTFNERASVTLNGANTWSSGSGSAYGELMANVTLSIPPNRTSTVIFVSASSPYNTAPAGSTYIRASVLAFCNDSLALPAGLEYVDDLDTATGGWGS